MIEGTVALIGLGVIAAPIAHKLNKAYKDNFVLVASGERRSRLEREAIVINGDELSVRIVSSREELEEPLGLILVCVKNYSLDSALADIKNVVSEETIILPLQNGIYSYDFFTQQFPENTILQGYLQGPNTEREGMTFSYTNSGALHMGDQANSLLDTAAKVYAYLGMAGVDVHLEQDIKRMAWKKMMLNVTGNTITALTNADYFDFKHLPALPELCRRVMHEFIKVAGAEGIVLGVLGEDDIDDVIRYYMTYKGRKKTSMLEDVRHKRKTENDFLAGRITELAQEHGIDVPMIYMLDRLIRIKECLYLQ